MNYLEFCLILDVLLLFYEFFPQLDYTVVCCYITFSNWVVNSMSAAHLRVRVCVWFVV